MYPREKEGLKVPLLNCLKGQCDQKNGNGPSSWQRERMK